MKRRGVLMVTGAYWPELSGGGLQCRTMIHALKDRLRFRVFTTSTDRQLPAASEVEGIPVALMEAMASARAVVSTAISGIPELVEHFCAELKAQGARVLCWTIRSPAISHHSRKGRRPTSPCGSMPPASSSRRQRR